MFKKQLLLILCCSAEITKPKTVDKLLNLLKSVKSSSSTAKTPTSLISAQGKKNSSAPKLAPKGTIPSGAGVPKKLSAKTESIKLLKLNNIPIGDTMTIDYSLEYVILEFLKNKGALLLEKTPGVLVLEVNDIMSDIKKSLSYPMEVINALDRPGYPNQLKKYSAAILKITNSDGVIIKSTIKSLTDCLQLFFDSAA